MKTIVILAMALMAPLTIANERDLNHWLESEFESHQYVMEELSTANDSTESLLNTIRVRLRATLSVEIPLLAKGKIRPEIELYYTK